MAKKNPYDSEYRKNAEINPGGLFVCFFKIRGFYQAEICRLGTERDACTAFGYARETLAEIWYRGYDETFEHFETKYGNDKHYVFYEGKNLERAVKSFLRGGLREKKRHKRIW